MTTHATHPANQATRVSVLITGVAGFIGSSVALRMLELGIRIIGIDNLNDYYSIALKRARLERLQSHSTFTFYHHDISDHAGLRELPHVNDVDVVIHLAAQAGVRYSLDHPFEYAASNLVGHLSILELVRHGSKSPQLVYASSSSVYGANLKTPFAETDNVESPVSLYAATKRADELMSESYARLYGMRQVGLRFFTVYGPWGRPDMAYWSFAERILAGLPIEVFNQGKLERDFTYIDDVVAGVIATALEPMKPKGSVPHRIYNIGNSKPVQLMKFIEILEQAIGKQAEIEFRPMQPGDVRATCADITAITSDYGFAPTTPLEVGIPAFINWFRNYKKLILE